MPLRTEEAENRESESELSATSDRKKQKTGRVSPNLASLRTEEGKKTARVSPNLVPLRTEEAENRESESELSPTSDRRSRKQGE
ncbi:hypothetical protein BBV17_23715 [Cytobacillus oceanisediminis]|uniref:Uncharacterized protein n=1 Tax=Cytobacillus oceanisediminis TaxID=665099 RepID=A0ABX3CP94_9BACI|nr:hypothetical protein BBV17_23715 [Cytobacillus oceanisediminis]